MPETNNISRSFLCSDDSGSVLLRAAKAFAAWHASRPPAASVPIAVLPSARATRGFRAHLHTLLDTDNIGLTKVVHTSTPGELPELLLDIDNKNLASAEILPRLWATALEDASKSNSSFDTQGTAPLLLTESSATPLSQLRDELSSVGLDCGSLLETRRDEMPDSVVAQFLKILPVELRYEELLRTAGLQDRWSARRDAWLERRWRYQSEATAIPVWLIGCAELAPFTQELLHEYSGPIIVAIAATQDKSVAFNDYGVLTGEGEWEPGEFSLSVTPSLWSSSTIISDRITENVSIAPNTQTATRTAVGIVNRSDRLVVSAMLAEREVVCRDGHGIALSQTPPWILLDSIRRFHATRHADDLLDLLVVLKERTTIAEVFEQAIKLDEFIAGEVPLTVFSESTPGVLIAKLLLDRVTQFTSGKVSTQEFLDGIFSMIRPAQPPTPDQASLECIGKFHEILPLMCELPGTDRTQAIAATLTAISRSTHEPRGEAPSVELLGWLELFLDESSNLELLNPTADLIPGPPPRNPFLPEGLRRQLGMATQETRANRDRYRWWIITNSGRNVHVTIQEAGSRGEPLMLSPSLLPLENPSRAAAILLDSAKGEESHGSNATSESQRIFAQQSRALPRLALTPPDVVSVSGIGDYLSCPYRFALKNIKKLKTIADFPHEFDALMFGSMLHSVLDSVVKVELTGRRFSTYEQLLTFLENRLEHEFAFPEERRGGTIIQRESLKTRLAAYAHWHLAFRQQGWTPLESEFSFKIASPSGLIVNGRIDRVERNTITGEVLLLDIKTSEKESTVDQFHRPSAAGGKWLSLQLPIYREGWRVSQSADDSIQPPRLGLLFIDGAATVSLQESKWTESDFEDADRAFRETTAAIATGAFWPPSEEVLFDPYPWITAFTVTEEAR